MDGIYKSISINAGDYVDTFEILNGDPLVLVSLFNPHLSVQFPSSTSVTLSRRKNISSTKVKGRKGTVKEMSGSEDWNINIDAEFISSNYHTGLIVKIRQIIGLFNQEGKIVLVNQRMQALGIHYMLIDSIDFPDYSYHSQPVRISGVSDSNYSFDIFGSADTYSSVAGEVI